MLKILLVSLYFAAQAWCVTVETSKGPIVGQKASDGSYNTFFGVPYAQVNEDEPFQDTLEYSNFATPFNASDPSIRCPQAIISESGILQCLRLNIYVPITDGTDDLPVFVWFHGGGLAFGSAGEYNAKHLVKENVIVVTANYRLGPYGFMCTSEIQNQGIKDMKTTLRWIKRNIQAFGGNPDKVTIGGESWGASAVDFLLYEVADFHQAIMQSGSRFSFGVSTRIDNKAPVKLASRLGYNTTNHRDAITFLNTADSIKVMRASRDLGMVFGVCEKPGDFRHLNKVKKAPILIGYNSKEAFADFATQPDAFYSKLKEELVNNLAKAFDLPRDLLINLANIILKFYLGNKTISRESMLELIELSSDFRVNYGAERSVNNYLMFGNPNVFKYVFSFTGGSPFENITGVGAYHTEELPYLFEWGTPLKTETQFLIRKEMVRMWTNFIKFGTPTPNQDVNRWLPSNLPSRPYLNIDLDTEMRHHVYHQRMAFWELLWTGFRRYRK